MFYAGKIRMMVKNLRQYVEPFSSDMEMLRTDRQICYINNIACQSADP